MEYEDWSDGSDGGDPEYDYMGDLPPPPPPMPMGGPPPPPPPHLLSPPPPPPPPGPSSSSRDCGMYLGGRSHGLLRAIQNLLDNEEFEPWKTEDKPETSFVESDKLKRRASTGQIRIKIGADTSSKSDAVQVGSKPLLVLVKECLKTGLGQMPPRPPPPPAPSSFVPHPPPDAAFDPFADEEAQFQMALQLSLQAASGKVNAQSSATEAERPGDITAISPSDDKPSRAADTLMTSLPKEIVSSILKCARWLLELEKPVKKKPVRSNPTRNLVTQRPNVRAMNAQRWLLSLRLVSRKWDALAKNAAWSRLLVTGKDRPMRIEEALLLQSGAESACAIEHISIDLPNLDLHKDHFTSEWNHFVVFEGLHKESKGKSHIPADIISQTKGLKSLHLFYPRAQNARAHVLMHPLLHDAICATGLRTLAMSMDVVFADLELILLKVPTLEHLKLEGGMNDPDDRDLVPAENHQAHLKTVKIVNRSHPRGVRQLCWILRPAIGTLQSVQFRLMAHVHGGTFHQLIGTAALANILLACKASLHTLRLDTEEATPPENNAFHEEPHLGRYDHLLSQMPHLVHLRLPAQYAGNGFSDALQGSSLEKLTLIGAPNAVSGEALAACIEQGHPARLKELYLYDMGPTTWSVREIRRLAEACRRREIALVVG